jgi:hypothetical protein
MICSIARIEIRSASIDEHRHFGSTLYKRMKLLGFFLLLSGGCLTVAAIELLHGMGLWVFMWAGFAVEILGLVLVVKAHPSAHEERR